MDGDFEPAKKPAKSLRSALDERTAETKKPAESGFKTPEEVAAGDDITEPADLIETIDMSDSAETPKKSGLKGLKEKLSGLKPSWPPTTKELLIMGVALILIGGLTSYILAHSSKPIASTTAKKHVKKLPPKPITVPSTLTGLQVDPSVNQRPVTGIMIENSLDARPQSGLADSGVVFEAIAEGGITRFLALYQDTAPEDIGPIRSARPYYVQWLLGFDAGYAHVGGSPEALADIRAWGVRDLDQFGNGGSYHRIASRYAPHNVYTGMSNLNQLETAKGYGTSIYTGFARNKKAAPLKIPTAKTIDLNLSGPVYNVHYDYAATTNSYNRSEGGAAHTDANGSRQISPTVVVALIVPYGIASDGRHSEYQTIGSGQTYVFQDGNVTIGTWTKIAEKSQITFADAAGKPLLLNPGQTWLTAVGTADKVSYAP
jgi:hypothetical protein